MTCVYRLFLWKTVLGPLQQQMEKASRHLHLQPQQLKQL